MARIYKRKDRRGREVFYIDYTVLGVRKRERVGYDKRQAEDALESRKTDIRRRKFDGILPEPTCRLEEIWKRYLTHSRTAKSAKQVEAYQARRRDEGIAPATVNKELQLLKTPQGRVRYLELGEVPRLLAACPGWLRPIVLMDMNTGMRRSEILGLKRSSVDRANRLLILEETKNNERKVLPPMNQTVWEVIEGLPPRVDTPYLFAETDGRPIKPAKVTVAFKRASRKAGIADFRLHDLRYHFASRLAMKGQNQQTLMELLGHKDTKMTTRYQHLSPEHLKTAVACLDEEMTGKVHSGHEGP